MATANHPAVPGRRLLAFAHVTPPARAQPPPGSPPYRPRGLAARRRARRQRRHRVGGRHRGRRGQCRRIGRNRADDRAGRHRGRCDVDGRRRIRLGEIASRHRTGRPGHRTPRAGRGAACRAGRARKHLRAPRTGPRAGASGGRAADRARRAGRPCPRRAGHLAHAGRAPAGSRAGIGHCVHYRCRIADRLDPALAGRACGRDHHGHHRDRPDPLRRAGSLGRRRADPAWRAAGDVLGGAGDLFDVRV